MDLVTRFQCYLIRRQMRYTMTEVRSARKRVEKMALKMQDLLISYGTTPEDKKFTDILFENCNRLADIVASLRPYVPRPPLQHIIDDIREMSKIERVLMAKQGIRPED